MRFKVRFVFDSQSGEAEIRVDDIGSSTGLRASDHDAHHERLAGALGRILAPDPSVIEVLPGAAAVEAHEVTVRTEEAVESARRRQTHGG